MEPTTTIEDLPNYVLVEILLHVGLNDLVHSARHVCLRWKEASEDVILWRNRVYSPARRDSDASVSTLLKQTPKLRSLVFNERGVGSVVLKSIVKYCPHLRKVMFFANQRFSAKFLKNLAVMCPNIEIIHVPSLESSIESKMKAIGQFLNLKEISFEDWPEKTVALKPIADGCPNLQKINLRRKMVSYVDFAYFIEKKKDELESLDINWRSTDYKCLIIPLTSCTKLKRLVIYEYDHTDLEASFNALSSLSSLTSLTLDNFGDADVKYLIDVFEKNHLQELEELCIEGYDGYEDRLGNIIVKTCPKLKQLFLRCINLSDDSLKNIHVLHDLESVDFRYTGLGDEGVKSLTRCKKIKYLDLTSCHNLTETGLMLMVEFTNLHALKLEDICATGLPFGLFSSRLPHLKYLSVNDCIDVDREALARLKEEKPRLVVDDEEPILYSDDEYDDDDDDDDENDAQHNGEDGQPVPEANIQGDGANELAVDQPNEVEGAQPMPGDHLQDGEVNEVAAAQLVPEPNPADVHVGAQVIEPVPEHDPEEDEEIGLLMCVQILFGIIPEPLPADEASEVAAVQLIPEPNPADVHIGAEVVEPVREQDSGEDEEIDLLICIRNFFVITPENVILPEELLLEDEPNEVAGAQLIHDSNTGGIHVRTLHPEPE